MARWRHRAFGLQLESSFKLPGLRATADSGRADVTLRLAVPNEIPRSFSGADGRPLWETVLGDGCVFRVEAGRLGDRLFTYGERATFHFSMPTGTLICDPTDRDHPAWRRQLLDTVLLCVAHQRGFELLHACAVECPEGLVAIAAGTGGGKTSVGAELVRRGGILFADDIVALARHGRAIVAHPAPPVMNLPRRHSGAAELGTRIAAFEEEQEDWIAVHAASSAPAALAAIFLLDRRPAVEIRVEALASNPLHLLPYSVGFRDRADRNRSRFEVFADIAATTPIVRIRADTALPPAELADLVGHALAAGPEARLRLAPT